MRIMILKKKMCFKCLNCTKELLMTQIVHVSKTTLKLKKFLSHIFTIFIYIIEYLRINDYSKEHNKLLKNLEIYHK